MEERTELAPQVVGRAARLHAHQARRQRGEERQDFAAAKGTGGDDLAGGIGGVDMKDMLGQVEANAGDLRQIAW